MTKLLNELNRLTNQELVLMVRVGIPGVSNTAEQILAKRYVWLYDIAEIDKRLSDISN